MNVKRLAITLVLALCLVTAGTGTISAADAGTDDCIPVPETSVTDSDVGTECCIIPPCPTSGDATASASGA
jgi:hypothetical protein